MGFVRRRVTTTLLLVLGLVLGASGTAHAQRTATDEMREALGLGAPLSSERAVAPGGREHYVIAQYREALGGWLQADERAQLALIDTTHTEHADPQLLRALVADRALRRIAPMALQLVWRTRDASWLRAQPEVTPALAIAPLLREGPVAVAVRRREALAEAGARSLALAMARTGRGPRTGSEHSVAEQDHSADRALLAAADCASRRDVSEASRAAYETAMTAGSDEDRAQVVSAALELLREMVSVARGLPAVPLAVSPAPAQTLDPFESEHAPAPGTRVRPSTRRGAARETQGVRPSAPGSCMDRYDCYGY